MNEQNTENSVAGPAETETANITLHIDEVTWFCLIDEDDIRLHEKLEDIEVRLYSEADMERVAENLVPEHEREKPAPVIGTVEHRDGKILDIEFDLSELED